MLHVIKGIGKLRAAYNKEDITATLTIAWPAIVEYFFVSFSSLLNSLMVSSLGPAAVAAIGLTGEPRVLGLAVFLAANVAISALVSRKKGEDNREEANKVYITSAVFAVVAGLLISTIMVIFADPIIRFCGSEETTHDNAVLYFRFIIGGVIFNSVGGGVNAAQRGTGRTKITMYSNLISCSLNVILNYLLIEGNFGFPALGITGTALGTLISMGVGCLISFASLFGQNSYICIPYIIKNKIKPAWTTTRSMVRISYAVFIEQLLMRIGLMSTSIMAAQQGTAALAAHQVANNLLNLSFSFGDGLKVTAVALSGYYLGTGMKRKAQSCVKTCQMMGTTISLLLSIVYFIGAHWFFGLFFEEESIIKTGVHITYILVFVLFFQICQVIYMGCLLGAGDALYTTIVSTASSSGLRPIITWICCYALGFGILGIWIGLLADQITRYVFAHIRFKRGNWMHIRV